jgi:hypothetical protein
MSNPSITLCPACHRLMAPRTLQTEDGEKVVAIECRDCGVIFNQSADVDEAKLQSVDLEPTTLPERQLRVAVARRGTQRRPLSTRFGIGRSAHRRR